MPVIVRAATPEPDCTDPEYCLDNGDLDSMNDNSAWYDPSLQDSSDDACSPATAVGTSFNDFNPDPTAVTFYKSKMEQKIKALAPLYQKAAQEEKVADWEILPGIHEIEHGLSRVNITNSFGFMTPFQMGAAEIAGAGGNPNDPRLASGHTLTDDEFVYVARLSLRILKSKAADSNVKVDMSKPMSPQDMAKVVIAYNTGQGTVSELKDTSPYAWAGWNSNSFKLPTNWANGNTYNQASPFQVPGAVTTVGMIRANGGIATGGDTQGPGSDCAGASAPITDTAPNYCKDGTAAGAQKIVCYAFLFDQYDYNEPGCRGTADQLNDDGPDGECKDIKGVKGLLDAVQECNTDNFSSDCKIPKFSPIIDCSGLVDAAIYGATGIDMQGASTSDYASNSHLHQIGKGDGEAGDILLFSGHTEVVVSNDKSKQHYSTFGAHQPQGPNAAQVSPSGYDYGQVLGVYRVVQ